MRSVGRAVQSGVGCAGVHALVPRRDVGEGQASPVEDHPAGMGRGERVTRRACDEEETAHAIEATLSQPRLPWNTSLASGTFHWGTGRLSASRRHGSARPWKGTVLCSASHSQAQPRAVPGSVTAHVPRCVRGGRRPSRSCDRPGQRRPPRTRRQAVAPSHVEPAPPHGRFSPCSDQLPLGRLHAQQAAGCGLNARGQTSLLPAGRPPAGRSCPASYSGQFATEPAAGATFR